MIKRRRGERTQKGNPHQLTREQHVIPAATLRRFALADGRVEVHLRDGRIEKLPIDHQLFCVERLWDQRSEAGYMKKIEDEFQALVDVLEAGRLGPLSPDEHRRITRFWSLWYWRNHFIDSPLEDTQMNGIAGEPLTQDKKEILESHWYVFQAGDGKIPARMMTGARIEMGIIYNSRTYDDKRWGVLRSPSLPLVIGDRPGSVMSIPASPRLLLAVDNPDGEMTKYEAFCANQVVLALSRNFAVIGRFSEAGGPAKKP
ncbi:MAG: hypothetical protein ACLGSH_18205 [Acidobacteriota bacterium]